MMSRFNHMYDIAFSVVSEREDGSDVTPTMLRTALLKRIVQLDAEQAYGGWEEACGAPCDTYEETDCKRNGHRDTGRGVCADCGEFI
jgi:hypothetical protein